MPKVQAVPPEYGSITPYLVIPRCAEAIEFYKRAFGATERVRMPTPDGKIGHCELTIHDNIVMLADSTEQYQPTSSFLCLYTEDCDAVFASAVAAGAKVTEPLSDKFYGDRAGTVRDPFGQSWSIMTHKEDVPPEEMEARMKAMQS